MRIAVCQVNPTIGDFAGNVAVCLDFARRAASRAVDLILFPEMAIPGYPPRDLLYDDSFVEAALAASADFAARCKGLPPVLFGSLARKPGPPPKNRLAPRLLNVACLAQYGKLSIAAEKRLLPVYDVFYEPRWFTPGSFHPPLEVAGRKLGILICEDLWDEDYDLHPPAELKAAGAEMLACLAASPYRQGIFEKRLEQARRAGLPLVFANLAGANDELIFDGRSFALSGGNLRAGRAFGDDLAVFDLPLPEAALSRDETPAAAELAAALTLGIRDFARKNRLERAFLGVSGGVDSAVAAVLAVKALGAENVTGVAIPSRYSDPRSAGSARKLCQTLGCGFELVELESLRQAAEGLLRFSGSPAGAVLENIQARLRMVLLMAYVNQYGGFLLNTSNKTELALGYSTLYGDLAGSLAPLADLTKPQVYGLARWLNAQGQPPPIPAFVLERPPSAELKPGQVDPFDYARLSPQMEALVQADESHPALQASEHKRWQFGIGLKVSERAFGRGRMLPVSKR
jgi:NAD+ synthetase